MNVIFNIFIICLIIILLIVINNSINNFESFESFESKKILILYPVNGLMNRIRSIISAKILADQHNMSLIILWVPEKNICNCNYNDIFGNNDTLWDYNNSHIKTFLKNKNINIDIHNNFKLDKIIEKDNKLFYWEFKNNSQKLNEFIKHKSHIKILKSGGKFFLNNSKIEELFSKIHKKIKYNNYILDNIIDIKTSTLGVHIRCSDKSETCLDSNIIINKINKLIKKHNINNVFIISNNLKKSDEISRAINVNIIKSNTHSTDRNNKENLQNALIEWLSLTRCNYLLLTKSSSFSTEAYNYNLEKYTYYLDAPNINLHD